MFAIIGASVGGIVVLTLLDAWLFGFEVTDLVDILAIFILAAWSTSCGCSEASPG